MGQLDGFLYDVFSILTHIGHACDGQVIRGTERRTDAAVSSALCIATRGERDVLRCVYALNHHTVLMVAGHRCDTSPLALLPLTTDGRMDGGPTKLSLTPVASRGDVY